MFRTHNIFSPLKLIRFDMVHDFNEPVVQQSIETPSKHRVTCQCGTFAAAGTMKNNEHKRRTIEWKREH